MAACSRTKPKRGFSLKAFVAGAGAFVAVFAACFLAADFLTDPDYILSRVNPDFSLNEGYANPDNLKKEWWSSLEQTSFEEGKETSSTIFHRKLLDVMIIEHIDENGEIKTLRSASRGAYGGFDNLYWQPESTGNPIVDVVNRTTREESGEGLYITSGYTRRENNVPSFAMRPITLSTRKVNDQGKDDQEVNTLLFKYDDNNHIIEQTKTVEVKNGNRTTTNDVGHRKLSYEGNRLAKTEDYGPDGTTPISSIVYEYEGNTGSYENRWADGTLIERGEMTYGLFGQIKTRTRYDSKGEKISEERYNYRILERYLVFDAAGAALVATVSVSLLAGSGVYNEIRRRSK